MVDVIQSTGILAAASGEFELHIQLREAIDGIRTCHKRTPPFIRLGRRGNAALQGGV